jgi:hypothetical protein
MKRSMLVCATALILAGCASGNARAPYATEPEYMYVVPVDRVVVVSQDVLATQGWTVYRVQRTGSNRIIWARRGDNEIVRIYASSHGQRVVVHGLREERERGDRGKHKGWLKRGEPRDIITAIDVRLRGRG